ncbi:hypothetical protein NQ317_010207 [Molorchus minor]|uniref:SPRY domain-containing protein n=1 Tax=Molorchus minor TaxID=1323400 RepID=A0ABQ9JAL1_9CUCU|nr:hypothetical protein NQ317_010207 [Molorchus minor]
MSSVSVFCCLRNCLDGIKFNPSIPHVHRENPIQLDTSFMGYEVVIVKGGQRVCGAGAALGNAPLVQSKSYFEVKIQQSGGMDEFSWTLNHNHIIYHKKQELYKINVSNGATTEIQTIQEGDIVGVAFDHIQLKFYVNGTEIDHAVTNIKGTVYPALYVDDGAILDIILDNFNYPPPSGFEAIMLEQSLL